MELGEGERGRERERERERAREQDLCAGSIFRVSLSLALRPGANRKVRSQKKSGKGRMGRRKAPGRRPAASLAPLSPPPSFPTMFLCSLRCPFPGPRRGGLGCFAYPGVWKSCGWCFGRLKSRLVFVLALPLKYMDIYGPTTKNTARNMPNKQNLPSCLSLCWFPFWHFVVLFLN